MVRNLRRLGPTLVAVTLVVAACGNSAGNDAAEPSDTTRPPATNPPSNEAPTTDAPALAEATSTTVSPATTAATTTTTTAAAAGTVTVAVEPMRILVTNDDGVDAPGIDALVTALAMLDDVEIDVVAPAENQSGSGMSLTDGAVGVTGATTASGVSATAVAGFPADAVRWAFENRASYDLVVSGSNSGQNIGPFTEVSGTVGAARYAAQQGVPGVAVSQALLENPDDIVFDDSVNTAIAWIEERRDDYRAGIVTLTGVNAATCPGGNRETMEVPVATDFFDRQPFEIDGASTATDPLDDVDAVRFGFTAISDLPVGS